MAGPKEEEVPVPKSLSSKKTGMKRNAGARKKERASPEVVVSSQGVFCFEALAEKIAERKAMVQAILNFSTFKDMPVESVTPEMVRSSSAGVFGWAKAKIEDSLNTDTTYRDTSVEGSGMELLPAAEDDKHGEDKIIKTQSGPPESKPPSSGAMAVAAC